jgi:diguanylate cyclase (GGDEF)-like protein
MKKVLIVDDCQLILDMLENELKKYEGLELYFAKDYKSTVKLLRIYKSEFHAAILDLHLPDAPNGEVIQLVNSNKIPLVVLSGKLTQELKVSLLKRDIVDIVLKDDKSSIKFAAKALHRVLQNYDTTVLIVDDSKTYRMTLQESLKRINLNTLEAENGEEALEVLYKHPEISLIITDYEMPKMNGLDFTIRVREKYQKDQIAIIAISSINEQDTITKFLRFGANDFVLKPFSHNEVITRINANLEIIDLFSQIKDMANKDFLTGMFNRRYLFDSGTAIFQKAKRKQSPIAVAMIDIDKFKAINDTYGHEVGDDAIKEVSKILHSNLRRSDLVARFGGEEFCIILEDIKLKNLEYVFKNIKNAFEHNIFESCGHTISYTVSIGICYGLLNSLDEMINSADKALYEAKINGRNKVVIKS